MCVRPKGVSQRRPVGEQIGEPVCDFALGWDRAKGRPLLMCVCICVPVCVCIQLRVRISDNPTGPPSHRFTPRGDH